MRRILLSVAILVAVWHLLSGKFDLLHSGLGVLAAVVVAVTAPQVVDGRRFRSLGLVTYVPWLLYQIVVSNLRVARLVLRPDRPIAPSFVRRRPDVDGARALTLLGSSITLTPGTLTVDVDGDEIFVHALDPDSAEAVESGAMATRVAKLFPEAADS